jgi:hypothetical protein
MMTPLLISSSIAAAVGLPLALIGIRGVRADDHPHCRKCGFDLFGLPVDANTCPECGSRLRSRRSIRIGRRVPRRRLLSLGLLLLLPALAVLGYDGVQFARKVNYQQFAPLSWLLRNARSGDTLTRDSALTELRRRLKDGKLSDAQIAWAADDALDIQTDMRVPWSPAWDNWFDKAQHLKRLPEDRWERYARQSVKFDLAVRPIVSRGDVLPVKISWSYGRGGSFSLSIVRATIDVSGAFTISLTPDPQELFEQDLPVLVIGSDLFKLPEGPQTVRVTLDLGLDDNSAARQGKMVVVTKAVTLTGQWTMGPPEGPVLLRCDPSVANAQRSAVRAELAPYGPRMREGLMLTVNRPPIGFAADVFVRVPGSHWRIAGTFSAPAGERSQVHLPWPDIPFSAKFEVLLSPNVWVARQSVFPLHEIWGDEIELLDAAAGPVTSRR